MRQQPRAPRRFLLEEEDAPNRLICYGNTDQISKILRRRLWTLYTRQLGQYASDPMPDDGSPYKDEEPVFLGMFEPYRDQIRAYLRELAHEQNWDIAMKVTHTRATIISPTGRYKEPVYGYIRNFHGVKLGPLPDEVPEMDFKAPLAEFFKDPQRYLSDPND